VQALSPHRGGAAAGPAFYDQRRMHPWQRLLGAPLAFLCVVCALSCASPARALASSTQTSIMIDDDQLIYASPDHVAAELEQMASLGIEQVKVSMVWSLVAPDSTSTHKPNFDATNPAAYPPGAWDRYDTLVRLAGELGISVYFQLTAPSPTWAVALHPKAQPYDWHPDVQYPNPTEFGQFAEAVGRRYDGSYVAAPPADDPSPPSLLGLGLPGSLAGLTGSTGTTGTTQSTTDDVIPAVRTWGIWNEPNEGSWLNPQYKSLGHGRVQLIAPLLYRQLVDNGWKGLAASGHAHDTVLIGETASGGITRPIPFLQALYCVDSHNRPLRGHAASVLGCPGSGSRSTFVRDHPGLFDIAGYAHHPYSFDTPPNKVIATPGAITLANLGELENELNRLLALDGRPRRGGLPMYLTEFGYKTNPPDPWVHTSLSQQATWLNQGEYISWKYPYVRTMAQFLLVDNAPNPEWPKGSRAYWSSFTTGLETHAGTPKPSYAAYRLPIWLPDQHHGSRVTVWGQLRPADHQTLQYGVLEFKPSHSSSFKTIRELQTGSSQGFFVAHVAIPSAGELKLAWLAPSGTVYYSRTIPIS
jgi:hypothetical protein